MRLGSNRKTVAGKKSDLGSKSYCKEWRTVKLLPSVIFVHHFKSKCVCDHEII